MQYIHLVNVAKPQNISETKQLNLINQISNYLDNQFRILNRERKYWGKETPTPTQNQKTIPWYKLLLYSKGNLVLLISILVVYWIDQHHQALLHLLAGER
jgi:hypothetical protein